MFEEQATSYSNQESRDSFNFMHKRIYVLYNCSVFSAVIFTYDLLKSSFVDRTVPRFLVRPFWKISTLSLSHNWPYVFDDRACATGFASFAS